MAKEYIERGAFDRFRNEVMDKFIDLCRGNDYNKLTLLRIGETIDSIFEKHSTQPAADVVEVVHGEWVLKSEIHKMLDDVDEEFYVECPFCKRTFYVPFELEEEKMLEYAKEHYPYCNCGAKMDGKGDE